MPSRTQKVLNKQSKIALKIFKILLSWYQGGKSSFSNLIYQGKKRSLKDKVVLCITYIDLSPLVS